MEVLKLEKFNLNERALQDLLDHEHQAHSLMIEANDAKSSLEALEEKFALLNADLEAINADRMRLVKEIDYQVDALEARSS